MGPGSRVPAAEALGGGWAEPTCWPWVGSSPEWHLRELELTIRSRIPAAASQITVRTPGTRLAPRGLHLPPLGALGLWEEQPWGICAQGLAPWLAEWREPHDRWSTSPLPSTFTSPLTLSCPQCPLLLLAAFPDHLWSCTFSFFSGGLPRWSLQARRSPGPCSGGSWDTHRLPVLSLTWLLSPFLRVRWCLATEATAILSVLGPVCVACLLRGTHQNCPRVFLGETLLPWPSHSASSCD